MLRALHFTTDKCGQHKSYQYWMIAIFYQSNNFLCVNVLLSNPIVLLSFVTFLDMLNCFTFSIKHLILSVINFFFKLDICRHLFCKHVLHCLLSYGPYNYNSS